MNKTYKNYFLYLILLTVVIKFFNTPYNTYNILKFNYNDRMTVSYGFCNNESWGFFNYVSNNYNLKNETVRIVNFGGFVSIHPLFPDIDYSSNKNSKYIIALNYEKNNNQTIFDSEIENIKKYFIKHRFGNCYLLEIND